MRISDWSSDVCSSDLVGVTGKGTGAIGVAGNTRAREATRLDVGFTETDFDFRTETAEVITDGSFDIISSAMIERSGIVERANIEVQVLDEHCPRTDTNIPTVVARHSRQRQGGGGQRHRDGNNPPSNYSSI